MTDKGFVCKEKPGYETTESLWGPNQKYLEKFCNLHIIPFLKDSTFMIGGGTYKFKTDNEQYSGETEWVSFSDQSPLHEFVMRLKEK